MPYRGKVYLLNVTPEACGIFVSAKNHTTIRKVYRTLFGSSNEMSAELLPGNVCGNRRVSVDRNVPVIDRRASPNIYRHATTQRNEIKLANDFLGHHERLFLLNVSGVFLRRPKSLNASTALGGAVKLQKTEGLLLIRLEY